MISKDEYLHVVNDLVKRIRDYDASSRLRWDSDMRAIKLWQEKTGKTLVWPDHTDLCGWLLDRLDEMEQALGPDLRGYFDT